jgi:hypothetical protein
MYHKRLSWLFFFPVGVWLCFLPTGKKEPLYSIQSGSKVAHYTEVVQKLFIILADPTNFVPPQNQ